MENEAKISPQELKEFMWEKKMLLPKIRQLLDANGLEDSKANLLIDPENGVLLAMGRVSDYETYTAIKVEGDSREGIIHEAMQWAYLQVGMFPATFPKTAFKSMKSAWLSFRLVPQWLVEGVEYGQ